MELSCDNGEKVRVVFALNCCDREIMSWVATTKGIDAALAGDLVMQTVENRFGPEGKPPKLIEWLTDNGSCFTEAETSLEALAVATTDQLFRNASSASLNALA